MKNIEYRTGILYYFCHLFKKEVQYIYIRYYYIHLSRLDI